MESTERSTCRGAAGGPVDQLLALGLLVARDRRHVAVPREVAIALRGGRTTREPADSSRRSPHPRATRPWWTAPRPVRPSSWSGTSSCCSSTGAPPRLRRCGRAAWACVTSRPPPSCCTPTSAPRPCTWRSRSPPTARHRRGPGRRRGVAAHRHLRHLERAGVADRWARVALAWLDSPRLFGLVGGREAGKPVNALVPDLERMWLPETRRAALEQVSASSRAPSWPPAPGCPRWWSGWPGCARGAPRCGPRRSPGWSRRPRSSASPRSAGCPCTGAPALPDDPAPALGPLLPEPVDHVLLQADLTAVAPGPLEQDLARHLGGRRHRVPRRRDRLPVHRGLGPARLRLGLVGGRGARLHRRRPRGPRCRRP